MTFSKYSTSFLENDKYLYPCQYHHACQWSYITEKNDENSLPFSNR